MVVGAVRRRVRLPAGCGVAGADAPRGPAWWLVAAAAALGVGAHLLNTLPDLADDERTGVRGLPHRLGERVSRLLAAGLLLAASCSPRSARPARRPPGSGWRWSPSSGSPVVAAVGRGRVPFQAAIAVALVDVVLLVAAG